jgi:LCP family protein required for cell wall assembly
VWVLLIGSDARSGEHVLRARADSIHLLAANPATGQATIIGFPRDSFVEIPDHGTGKINTALGLGGPELLARTVNRFTGLPVQYWVVAGFEAFKRVVDEVGGVDVEVVGRMDDWDSGAHFQPGWHHFDGERALAFSRNRHEFADGDLSRSHNQGVVILAALAKLRSEVGDEAGLLRWLGVAFRHLSVDLDHEQGRQLLAVARRTDPADVTNLVLQGRGGMAGSQSVVYLDAQAAARIADDVRPDAAIGPAKPTPPTPEPPPTSTPSVPPPPSTTSPVSVAAVPTAG